MWNIVHNRNVQTLVTQSPSPVEGPYFDTAKTLHNIDKLAVESITPRMTLPKSDKKVIAVGLFPAEFWDISSQLTWYKFHYAEFMEALRRGEVRSCSYWNMCKDES